MKSWHCVKCATRSQTRHAGIMERCPACGCLNFLVWFTPQGGLPQAKAEQAVTEEQFPRCANCGQRAIGRLEKRFYFQGQLVCAPCWLKLNEQHKLGCVGCVGTIVGVIVLLMILGAIGECIGS